MDKRTIAAARLNHPRAVASVLHELQDPWYRYAVAVTGSPATAGDVVQASALRVVAEPKTIADVDRFDAWAMGVVAGVVRDMSAGKSSPQLDRARAAGLAVPPVDGLEGDRPIHDLSAACPRDVAEAFVARVMERLTARQSAAALAISPADVYRLAPEGIAFLRTHPPPRSFDFRLWYSQLTYPANLRDEFFRRRRPRWVTPIAAGMFVVSVVFLWLGHEYRKPMYIPPVTTATAPRSP